MSIGRRPGYKRRRHGSIRRRLSGREALEQPVVNVRHVLLEKGEMAVLWRQSRLDAGDSLREPAAVADRDELVLLAVPVEDRHADRLQLEAPRRAEGLVVVEPAVPTRAEPGLKGLGEV